MSKLGEAVLKGLVSVVNRTRTADESAPQWSWESYIRWQYASSERLFSKYPNFDLRGKEVLEIGCGTGGRTAFLATQGVKRIVGIDINAQEIQVARDLCPALYPAIQGRCEYAVSAEDAALEIGQFDIVVMTDCMEHVVSPPRMLRLGYEYTRPGGRLYFSSVGWYHHKGSHMGLIPFVNVFFSDETIINVTRWYLSRPDYIPNHWDSDPPTERWNGLYNLRDRPGEHLNKLTVKEMKQLLKYSPFSRAKINVIGFGGGHPLFRPLDPLRHVPWFQEAYHSLVVAECER